MKELTWKYVKPLKEPECVERFLRQHRVDLPDNLVACIKANNGGRPSEKRFDTDHGKDYVFKSLFSYNEGDLESIARVYPGAFEEMRLFPIGTDAAGNFVCFDMDHRNYILLNHETDARERIII